MDVLRENDLAGRRTCERGYEQVQARGRLANEGRCPNLFLDLDGEGQRAVGDLRPLAGLAAQKDGLDAQAALARGTLGQRQGRPIIDAELGRGSTAQLDQQLSARPVCDAG